MIVKIKHYGVPFISTNDAKLIFTGINRHYMLLKVNEVMGRRGETSCALSKFSQ